MSDNKKTIPVRMTDIGRPAPKIEIEIDSALKEAHVRIRELEQALERERLNAKMFAKAADSEKADRVAMRALRDRALSALRECVEVLASPDQVSQTATAADAKERALARAREVIGGGET